MFFFNHCCCNQNRVNCRVAKPECECCERPHCDLNDRGGDRRGGGCGCNCNCCRQERPRCRCCETCACKCECSCARHGDNHRDCPCMNNGYNND